MSSTDKQKVMLLDQAVNFIHTNRVVLAYEQASETQAVEVNMWTPTKKMGQPLKRAVHKYNKELKSLMTDGAAEVCPTSLHQKFYRYAGNGTYICDACINLDRSFT